jgi:hypothetical protein
MQIFNRTKINAAGRGLSRLPAKSIFGSQDLRDAAPLLARMPIEQETND